MLATQNLPLYECTNNRWWGCGLRLDAAEWADKTSPGHNKMGEILMEVRAAIKKNTYNEEALLKSPTAIINTLHTQYE